MGEIEWIKMGGVGRGGIKVTLPQVISLWVGSGANEYNCEGEGSKKKCNPSTPIIFRGTVLIKQNLRTPLP